MELTHYCETYDEKISRVLTSNAANFQFGA